MIVGRAVAEAEHISLEIPPITIQLNGEETPDSETASLFFRGKLKRIREEVNTMQFSKLNREGAENVYRVVKSVQGATITTGLGVSLVNTSTDGVSAVIADAAADYTGFIGVAVEDIANNDYGRVQVNGFVNSILVSHVGSSITINAGDPMVPAPSGFFSGAPTYANSGFRYLFASNVPVAVSAAAYASGLIKTM